MRLVKQVEGTERLRPSFARGREKKKNPLLTGVCGCVQASIPFVVYSNDFTGTISGNRHYRGIATAPVSRKG